MTTADEAMRELDAILATFNEAERESFWREIDRQLGHMLGKKIPRELEDKVATIIAEEIKMILAARDA